MMIHNDTIAFVLKHYAPKRDLVALLDRHHGRIVASIHKDTLSVGTLISYDLKKLHNWYVIDHVDILHLPLEFATHHLLFWHHIVEICYHFIPEGTAACRVYDLLLYVVTDPPLCRQRQKNILFLLFTLLGMYPDDVVICREYARAIKTDSFEDILATQLDQRMEKYIPQWLYRCITMHAQGQKFKTLHYLNEK